jgi:hypothetical protein
MTASIECSRSNGRFSEDATGCFRPEADVENPAAKAGFYLSTDADAY